MAKIVIKLDDKFDINMIDRELRTIFDTCYDITFIFDIIDANILELHLLLSIIPLLKKYKKEIREKLTKSIIVAPYKWQRTLLNVFFFIYVPIKPYEVVQSI